MQKVSIIGGGIGGLATANLLAKKGYDVTVYESGPSLGGRMGMLRAKGFNFDTGPSWYLMPEVYDRYYRLLGTSTKQQLDLVKLTPAYQVFFEGEKRPIIISGKLSRDAQTFESHEKGAGTSLETYVQNAEKTYTLAQKYFLYTTFQRPADILHREVLANGLSMALQSARSIHSLTKRFFKNQKLQQILEYPSVFLGSSPFRAPALYSLMSYLDFKQGVYYPKRGMYAITQSMVAIGKKYGVTYRVNSPVASITVSNGIAAGVTLKNGQTHVADIVISNADLHHTQTALLETKYQDYPQKYWDRRTAGPSALLMYLGVRGKLPELKHHNLFFVRDWQKNFDDIAAAKNWPTPASLYVCKPSATDDTVAPKDHENVFVLVPLPANTSLHKNDYRAFAESYIAQFSKQAGITDLASRIVYQKIFHPGEFATAFNSWNGTALGLAHELRQSAMFRPKTKSRKVKGLYYVGANVQPGIGVPMCLISAELVYNQIVASENLQ